MQVGSEFLDKQEPQTVTASGRIQELYFNPEMLCANNLAQTINGHTSSVDLIEFNHY